MGRGDAVQWQLEQRLGFRQAVSLTQVNRVETVAQEEVQHLTGKPPRLSFAGQFRSELLCHGVEAI
jgi:hypothetical protein